MASTKSRNPIAAADIQRIFGDARIDTLATIARLPADANRKRFAYGIREAARVYARDARTPTDNELHAEIAALYSAAKRKRVEQVADLFEKLSPKARELLRKRATRLSLPLPASEDLRDAARKQKACEAVLSLSQCGGDYIERSRRRSDPWRPLLVGPKPCQHFPKRDAERDFVMWLQLAWLEATGKPPSLAANPARPGPFVRMVRKCLALVGAGHADAVGLINELNRRRIQSRPVRPQN
jgi:hypothetical protein